MRDYIITKNLKYVIWPLKNRLFKKFIKIANVSISKNNSLETKLDDIKFNIIKAKIVDFTLPGYLSPDEYYRKRKHWTSDSYPCKNKFETKKFLDKIFQKKIKIKNYPGEFLGDIITKKEIEIDFFPIGKIGYYEGRTMVMIPYSKIYIEGSGENGDDAYRNLKGISSLLDGLL